MTQQIVIVITTDPKVHGTCDIRMYAFGFDCKMHLLSKDGHLTKGCAYIANGKLLQPPFHLVKYP